MKIAIRKSKNYYKVKIITDICPNIKAYIKNIDIDEINMEINNASKLFTLGNNIKLVINKFRTIINLFKQHRSNNYKNIKEINYNLAILYLALNDSKAVKYLFLSTKYYDDALFLLGCYYMINRNYQNSEKFFLVQKNMVYLGILYEIMGHPTNDYFLQAINLATDDKILILIAKYYRTTNRTHDMKKYLHMAINKYSSRSALEILGFEYVIIEQYDRALKYLNMALNRGSNKVLNTIGYVYYMKNKIDDAKKYFLLSHQNNNPLALFHLGCCYDAQHDYDQMLKYLYEAIDIDDFYSNLAIHYIAQYFEEINDFDNMLKFNKINVDRGHIESISDLTEYYFNKKDYSNMFIYLDLGLEQNGERCYNIAIKYYFTVDITKFLDIYGKASDYKINVDTYYINQYFIQNNDLINMKKFEKFLDSRNKSLLSKLLKLDCLIKIRQQCDICILSEEVIRTCCNHYLCIYCFVKIDRCPYCRCILDNKIENN